MSSFSVSVSLLETALDCLRKTYYAYFSELPKATDLPRLCGIEVHRHIRQLHEKTADPRPFFYTSKRAAIAAWIFRWRRAVEEALLTGKLEAKKPNSEKRFERIGLICVARYWDANLKLPPPLETEWSCKFDLTPQIRLRGIFDQIRGLSPEYIRRHRPELIDENGNLKPGYSPVAILDIKTGSRDYSFNRLRFREDPTLFERIKNQFDLHENLQATFYTFLYEKVKGKKPIGFIWFHARSGKGFFTYREEKDYATLYGVLNHVLDNIAANSFPKHVTGRCSSCDFVAPCREDRGFMLVQPENLEDAAELNLPMVVPTDIKKIGTQLNLKFRMPRRKREKPAALQGEFSFKKPVLKSLPWDALTPEEEIKIREAQARAKTEPPRSV